MDSLPPNFPAPDPAAAASAGLGRLLNVIRVLDALAARDNGLKAPPDEEVRAITVGFRATLLRHFVALYGSGAGLALDLESVVELFDAIEALEAEAGLSHTDRSHSVAMRAALVDLVRAHEGQELLAKRMARALPAVVPPAPPPPRGAPLPPPPRPAAPTMATAAPPPARPSSPPAPPSSPPSPPRATGPEPAEAAATAPDAFLFGPPKEAGPLDTAGMEAPPDPSPPAGASPTQAGQEEKGEATGPEKPEPAAEPPGRT